jgi:O-antigen ligase
MPDLSLGRRAVNTQLELEPDAESIRRSFRMLKEAGFTLVRQQFAWAAIEAGGKGQFVDTSLNRSNWERADTIMRLASEEGIEVLARLDLPPDWARPAGSYKTHPPVDSRDYGDFVETFVTRYRDRLRYVQLWNEPNLNEEWGRRPVDPNGYVELLRAGYDGAKRGNPAVRIVSGALAQTLEPDDPSASGLDDLAYLDRMYAAGAKPFFDVLAANGYGLATGPDDRRTAPAQANFPRVLLTRQVMERYGDTGKAVWIAEFGWNALPPDWAGEPSPWGQVAPEKQATYVLDAYERANVEWPWMGPMALWLFRKPGADSRDPTPFFALVDSDWQPREAYTRLRDTREQLALGPGFHQETNPALAFKGTWQWSPDPQASGTEMRESPVSGAAVRWQFRGTQVDLVAPRGPSRGRAYVQIDGAYTLANRLPLNVNGQATIDFYSPEVRPQQRIPLASGLPDRVHEVELTLTGDGAPESGGSGVGIDAIVVGRDRPVTALYLLVAAWASTALAGAWLARPPAGALHFLRPVATPSRSFGSAAIALITLPWTRWLVFALAASLPFAALNIRAPGGLYSPVELYAVAVICLYAVRVFFNLDPAPRAGAYLGAATLMVVAALGSTAVADYPRLALRELRTLIVEPVLVYVAASTVLRGRRDSLLLASVFVMGAAAAAALALGQAASGRGLVQAEGVTRAAGLYRSPNNLALLLGRALPVAVTGALYARRPLQSFFVVTASLSAAALFFTFSRGAWLAALAAVLVVAWPRLRRVASGRWRRIALLALGAGVPAAIAIGALALRFERFRSLFSAAGTGVLRFHLWGSSLRMAADHPIFGVGLDQFLYHYQRYIHPDAWREPNLSHPHNLVLDFWLRLGLLGLVALAWALWTFLRSGGPSLTDDDSTARMLSRAASGAAVAFVLHGLVDNSYFVIDLAYSTWIVLLIAELAARHDAGTEAQLEVVP